MKSHPFFLYAYNLIPATTTYYKIAELTKKFRLIQGGQGAGKNWAIAQRLIEHMLDKRVTVTVVTDIFENLKDGVVKDLRDMFYMTGMVFEDYYNEKKKRALSRQKCHAVSICCWS